MKEKRYEVKQCSARPTTRRSQGGNLKRTLGEIQGLYKGYKYYCPD